MISLAHSLAFPALIVPALRSENGTLNFTVDDGSWFTSTFSMASPFGSMIGGLMMDRYGRKITLATPLVPLVITWIILANAQSHVVLFTCRVFLGIFGGFGPPICQVISNLLLILYKIFESKNVFLYLENLTKVIFFLLTDLSR